MRRLIPIPGRPHRNRVPCMYYDMSIFNTAIVFSFETAGRGRRTETRFLL